jgi:hypothetical protein
MFLLVPVTDCQALALGPVSAGLTTTGSVLMA